MVIETRIKDYAHQALNRQYGGPSGYYTPRREVLLDYRGRQVLYILGHAVVESSCCGSGNWDYALVPGFVVNWRWGTNQAGLLVSSIEPIEGSETVKDLASLIESREKTGCITFW